MMVSFIQSNYMGFGSGCVEPTFGISLQNRGAWFCVARQRSEPSQPGGTGQAAVSHHHPGVLVAPGVRCRRGALCPADHAQQLGRP